MQFKVPQNITMEDRIAGPLTVIQFIIVVVGIVLAFLAFNIFAFIPPVNEIIAVTIGLLAAILAVGKFNDQPLYRFFRFIILYLITPRTRVWHKGGQQVMLVKPSPKVAKTEGPRANKGFSKEDIARLAVVLDSRGSAALPPQSPIKKP